MQDFLNKKIVLGVCGGIAAYKAISLVRELTQLGAIVRVVMTESSQAFVTPMTFQALSGNSVRCELFDSQAERSMGHIELARWADYLLIAPATANCLAKMAQGLADDLLSRLYLVTRAPVIVCPAMNHSMWSHQATQNNCDILSRRGVVIVGPDEGAQACGEYGLGRMSEMDAIINALRLHDVARLLKGHRVLITAGPTQEMIDPVRYMTNRSSGKMGYALAQAALMAGAEVTLISGPVSHSPPSGVHFYSVDTALSMFNIVMEQLQSGMIFIGAAAVADYHVSNPALQKLKKQDEPSLTLNLQPNPDILTHVSASKKAAFVVGFAAETSDVLNHAKIKLEKKTLDMIVANQVGEGVGFDVDENEVTVLTKHTQTQFALMHKMRIAGGIIALIAENIK